MFLEHHIHRRLLRPCAVGGIHLAEVPLYAEENVAPHDEANRRCKGQGGYEEDSSHSD